MIPEWPEGAPGSDEAIQHGCECPQLDNAHGRGRGGDGARFGWFMVIGCPTAGHDRKPDVSTDSRQITR